MYGTTTKTTTYTVLDIRKTFEGCEADIRTIARRTGKWTMEFVDKIFHDILLLAENEYVHTVDIALLKNDSNEVLKATKFIVNTIGNSSESERAGKNNDWEDMPNTHLTIILSYTMKWIQMSTEDKSEFLKKLQLSWESTSIDNTFPHLNRSDAQLYASKGYELKKTNYK